MSRTSNPKTIVRSVSESFHWSLYLRWDFLPCPKHEGEIALHEAKLFQVDTDFVYDGAAAVGIPAASVPTFSLVTFKFTKGLTLCTRHLVSADSYNLFWSQSVTPTSTEMTATQS